MFFFAQVSPIQTIIFSCLRCAFMHARINCLLSRRVFSGIYDFNIRYNRFGYLCMSRLVRKIFKNANITGIFITFLGQNDVTLGETE